MLSLLLALQLLAPPTASATPAFELKVIGAGRPMILVPGFVSSGEVWNDVVAHYRATYECHVLTLAGFAGVPATDPVSLARVRDAIADYIRAKKLDRPVLVGHSLGGFVVTWFAATTPELAGPVVSVDGVPFISALTNPAATPASVKAQAEQMQTLYASLSQSQLAMQSRLAFASMITEPARVDAATKWAASSDPSAAGRLMADLMTTDLREAVARITSPLLLVGAGKAMAASSAQLARARKGYEAQVSKVASHEVVFAVKALHFIMYDDLPFLLETMDRFLRRVGAPAGARR